MSSRSAMNVLGSPSTEYREQLNASYAKHIQKLPTPTGPLSRELMLLTQIPSYSQVCIQNHAIASTSSLLTSRDSLGVPSGYVPQHVRAPPTSTQEPRRESFSSHHSAASTGSKYVPPPLPRVQQRQTLEHIRSLPAPVAPYKYSDEERETWLTGPRNGFGERFEHGALGKADLTFAREAIDRLARIGDHSANRV